MRQVLGDIGVPFVRFEALDPERAARHPGYSLVPPLPGRPWAPGELACLLSHYEVWRLIAEGPDEFGMVLEDDLLVDPRLKKVLEGEAGIPPDADVVKLETGSQMVTLSRRSVSTVGGPAWHRLLSVHDGAGAYLLSRRTARLLTPRLASFRAPADDLLFKGTLGTGKRLRVYQAVPALAIQSVILPPAAQLKHLSSGLEDQRRQAWERATDAAVAPPTLHARLARRLREAYWSALALRQIVPFGDAT